jgi:predicted transcriptional regulator of viral defense system
LKRINNKYGRDLLKKKSSGPTSKELERYLIARADHYDLTFVSRIIQKGGQYGDFLVSTDEQKVLIEVRTRLNAEVMAKVRRYSKEVGMPVHVWTLGTPDDLRRSAHPDVHIVDPKDLKRWLRKARDTTDRTEGKMSIPGELRDLISYLERKGYSIISSDIVAGYLGSRDRMSTQGPATIRTSARTMIHRLSQRRWLDRITRDAYLLIPMRAKDVLWSETPYLIASNIVRPCYVSLGAALNYHGLSGQAPFQYDVITTRRRAPFEYQGQHYNFLPAKKDRFFGFKDYGKGPQPILIAEPEKAVIDVLDRSPVFSDALDPLGALEAGGDGLDLDRLVDHALRMGNCSLVRRLGFILERLGNDALLEGVTEPLLERLASGIGGYRLYVPLSVAHGRGGARNDRWKILDNIAIGMRLKEARRS